MLTAPDDLNVLSNRDSSGQMQGPNNLGISVDSGQVRDSTVPLILIQRGVCG